MICSQEIYFDKSLVEVIGLVEILFLLFIAGPIILGQSVISVICFHCITSTNWCILVAKLNIPDGLNHHLQRLHHHTACLIQNARWGLQICQTLSFWIKMANRIWKVGFEEDVDKNAKNSSSLTLLPVDCLNSDQL